GKADILASLHQCLVHILGTHVTLFGVIQHLQDLDARQGDLQTSLAQLVVFNHVSFSCSVSQPPSYGYDPGPCISGQDSGSQKPLQKTQLLLSSFSLTAFLAIAGCSFPGVYKIDIQQGNVVTQDMINQLRPGMTRRQVRFIMGNPMITDTFHPNRWDYLYSIQP